MNISASFHERKPLGKPLVFTTLAIIITGNEKPIKSERLEVFSNLFTSRYANNPAFPKNVFPLPFCLWSSPCPPISRNRSVVISDKGKMP